jgi:hypothetical protein
MAALALVATATAQASKSPRPTARTAKSDTLRILEQKLPEVQFQETPFEQVVEWLRDFTKLNISVRWQKLTDAGIERDKPVTIQVHNLRLSQVLWMIMNELGGSEVKLAYRASGNLLIFSTAEDLDKEVVTKVYDIADLLLRIPRATRSSGFDVSQGLGQGGGQGGQGGGGGGGGGGSGMFGKGGQQQQQSQYDQSGDQDQTDKLIELIQDAVEPDSWQKYGGSGSIKAYQRVLVVRNTILVHQRLGGYVTEGEILGR